jgi:hypothetical protein
MRVISVNVFMPHSKYYAVFDKVNVFRSNVNYKMLLEYFERELSE